MKNTIKFLLVILLCGKITGLNAQAINLQNPVIYQQSGLNYRAVQMKVDSLFVGLADTVEGNDEDRSQHWKHFWNDRSAINFPNGKNSFSGIHDLAKIIIDNPSSLCTYADEQGGGGNWQSIGPDTLFSNKQALGLTSAIWASPTDSNFILAGSGQGGLWKTTDGGKHWYNITDGANISGTFGVGCIAVNPSDEDEIWITAPSHFHLQGYDWFNSSYNFGVLYTTDGGSTWTQESYFANNFFGQSIHKLVYSPDGNIYAFDSKHIYMKTPFVNWDLIYTLGSTSPIGGKTNADTSFTDIDILPASPYTLYASTNGVRNGNDKEAYLFAFDAQNNGQLLSISTYSGLSINFSYINDMSIPCDSLVYFNCLLPIDGTSYDTIRFMKFNNLTGNFTVLSNQHLYQFVNSYAIGKLIVSPANRNVIYHGSPQGLGAVTYMSVDGGVVFNRISEYFGEPTHGDIRDMWLQTSSAADSGKGDILFLANDGGVSKKPSGRTYTPAFGNTCININGRGLAIGQFYGLADQEGEKRLLSGGAMHNGLFGCEGDKEVEWDNIFVRDGFESEFDGVERHRSYYQAWVSAGDKDLRKSNSSVSRKIANQAEYIQEQTVMKNEPRYNVLFPIKFHEETKKLFAGRTLLWVKDTTTNNSGYWRRFDKSNSLVRGWDSGTWYNNGVPIQYSDSLVLRCMAFDPKDTSVVYLCYFSTKGGRVIQVTQNAGVSWTDVTPPNMKSNAGGYSSPISAIACGDIAPSKVWVGKSMIQYDNNGDPVSVDRAIFSDNYGLNDSWVDVSDGLPPFPVTSLVYQSGSDDIVYAGTDVGVYRFVKQTPIENSYWVCFNNNFPRSLINDLEINYCEGKIRAATHGRSMWESDLFIPNNEPGVSNSITSNTTWTGERFIEGSIKVESGNTLTIYGTATSPTTIHLPKWGNIVVEKGAKLIIDGAKLTNSCGDMWTGIYVDADETLHQGSTGGGYFTQGYCEIKNDAIIENSENGVCNKRSGLGGGIIIAENSTFRNNRRSLEFYKYQNYNPANNNPKEDMCRFTNCVFEVNNDFSPLHVFSYFVTAWGIDGVKFIGCDFKNLQTNATPREKAFYSIDASYRILPLCTSTGYPCTTWKKCTFEGLDFGIDANGYSGVHDLQCDMSEFNDNQYGIRINAANSPILTRNEFEIGTITNSNLIAVGAPDLNNTNPYGIDLYLNQHFIMEENEFNGIQYVAKSNKAIGLWVEYSQLDNQVYKNEYSELAYANVAFDWNSYVDALGVNYGLKYSCNLQSDNLIDNMIHSYWPGGGLTDGIHPVQGSTTKAAGNTFSHTSAFLKSDIHNYAANSIDY